MQESKGGAVQRYSAIDLGQIGKRDFDRVIYRETHISKRAKRFISVSGNGKGQKR